MCIKKPNLVIRLFYFYMLSGNVEALKGNVYGNLVWCLCLKSVHKLLRCYK